VLFVARLSRADVELRLLARDSNQGHELALNVGVAVDVPLRCQERPMTGEQLDVPERTSCTVNKSSGPGDEGAATGM
jgi:hypothetical protein